MIKKKVQKVLEFLLRRKPSNPQRSRMPLDPDEELAVRMIVASSFNFDISSQAYGTIFVPTFYRKDIEGSGSSISLPDDILKNEIFSKMTFLHSSTMMKMVGKSVRPKKYEYENLVDIIPTQALVILSKLHEAETDANYKEYLMSLMMKAWAVYPFQFSFFRPPGVENAEFLTTIFAFAIQVLPNGSRRMLADNLIGSRLDIIYRFIDLGVVVPEDVTINNYPKDMISIPDDYLTFIERWSDHMEKSPLANTNIPMLVGFPGFPQLAGGSSLKDQILLYKDLKNGKFSSFYDCRLMADAIRKGYIKKTSRITGMGKYYIFLESLELSTREDKELVRKFIEPNFLTDFFLGGIKPTLQSILDSPLPIESDMFVVDCILNGMDFVDQERAADKLSSLDESVLAEDQMIIANVNDVLILKDLGNDRLLVLEKVLQVQPVVIRKFGHLYVKMFTFQTQTSFIKYLGDATDEQIKDIISFCMKTDAEIHIEGIVDDAITDLELYKRYVINAQTIREYVYKQ